MNAHESPHPNEGDTIFSIEPALRKRQVLFLYLRMFGMGVLVYLSSRATSRLPFLPIAPWIVALVFGFPALVCWLRTKWGTAVRFEMAGIAVLNRGQVKTEIPRQSIESIDCRSAAITIRYRVAETLKFAIIAREGFTVASWTELSAILHGYRSAPNS